MKKIQLSIPERCHENWDNMSPTQQGRFCNACAKEVIDFSNMSDSEMLNYFLSKKPGEKVCGRSYPDQLNRDITSLPQKKRYWQWHYILPALLFFMKPVKSKAQGRIVHVEYDSIHNKPVCVIKEPIAESKEKTVFGTVKDKSGNPVPYASIKIVGTGKGTTTGNEGRYSLKIKNDGVVLLVTAITFMAEKVTVNEGENNIVLKSDERMYLGEVVVTRVKRKKKNPAVCVIKDSAFRTNILKDTLGIFFKPNIRIYPNPVERGGVFNIGMNLKQSGNFALQVADAIGNVLTEKQITVVSKEHSEQLTVPGSWSSGVYYIKIINENGKLAGTASMMVQ